MDNQTLRRKYNDAARWYDAVGIIPEWLGVRQLRRKLLQFLLGRTLEVACGTGLNLPIYPHYVDITAVDLSDGMLSLARKRAQELYINIDFSVMDGEHLAFREQSFDTVVSSLSLCSFPNPVGVLYEMARVCRQGGQIILLEHGRSNCKYIEWWQNYWAEPHSRALGCYWNREPLDLVRQAKLSITWSYQTFFGIFHLIRVQV